MTWKLTIFFKHLKVMFLNSTTFHFNQAEIHLSLNWHLWTCIGLRQMRDKLAPPSSRCAFLLLSLQSTAGFGGAAGSQEEGADSNTQSTNNEEMTSVAVVWTSRISHGLGREGDLRRASEFQLPPEGGGGVCFTWPAWDAELMERGWAECGATLERCWTESFIQLIDSAEGERSFSPTCVILVCF